MLKVTYNTLPEFLYAFKAEAFSGDDEDEVSIVCHYGKMKKIIKHLLQDPKIEIEMIDSFGDVYHDGYDKEFILTLTNDGMLWVEKAINDLTDNYKYLCGLVFLDGDCNSNAARLLDKRDGYFIEYEIISE